MILPLISCLTRGFGDRLGGCHQTHSQSLFFQLIETNIVLFKSFGTTLEFAFLIVGTVIKCGVKILSITLCAF